jgi:hypothetical protein
MVIMINILFYLLTGKYADLFGFSEWEEKPTKLLINPTEAELFRASLKEQVMEKQKIAQEKKTTLVEQR